MIYCSVCVKLFFFSQQKGVVYLDRHERTQYKLNIREDVIYQGNDSLPFDTTNFKGKLQGYAAYVVDKKGNIYVGEHKTGTMHHSSFVAGSSVISAGMIKVKKGKISAINHHSGHYIPKKENLENFLLTIDPNVFDNHAQIKFSTEDRSKTIKKFADFLINIRKNPDYNWLSHRMLVQLTKLGHYISSVNQKKSDYHASSYYKDHLKQKKVMDIDETTTPSLPSNQK